MQRLFDVEDKQRRTLAGNLPVLLGFEVCPDCQAPTTTVQWDQPALVRHGGYGATQRRTVRHCMARCGWGYEQTVEEVRPAN